MHRKWSILIGCAVAACWAATALAASQKFESDIQVAHTGEVTDTVLIAGDVTSEEEKCVSGRTVKAYSDPEHHDLVDTGRTSRNGSWAVRGNFESGEAHLVLVREELGDGGKRIVCRGDTAETGSLKG